MYSETNHFVLFENEPPLEVGVTQMHERRSLDWSVVKYHKNCTSRAINYTSLECFIVKYHNIISHFYHAC